MAFLTLGEAVNRVLSRLADEREGKAGRADIEAARASKVARMEEAARGKGSGHAPSGRMGVTLSKNETPAEGSRSHDMTTGPEHPSIGKRNKPQADLRSEVSHTRL